MQTEAESKNNDLKGLEEKAIGYKELLTTLNNEKEQAQTVNEELMTELVEKLRLKLGTI